MAAPSPSASRLLRLAGTLRRRARWVGLGVVVLGAAGGLLYLNTWPPLAIVESGSMTPTIKTGDVVLLGRLGRAPRVGDVVAVTVPDAARSRFGYPPRVIHRVIRVAPNGDLTTKGDALKHPDPFTTAHGTVTSGVVATIPAGGRVLAFLTSTLGLIWLAGGAVLLVLLPQLDRRRERAQREQESIDAVHSKLEALERRSAEHAERLRVEVLEAIREAADDEEAVFETETDGEPEPEPEHGARPEPEREAEPELAEAPDPEPELAPAAWQLAPPAWDGDCVRTGPPLRSKDPLASPFWEADLADVFAPPAPEPPARWDDRAELELWPIAPPAPVVVRRRTGGLLAAVERRARSRRYG